jgi:hypothetical protein
VILINSDIKQSRKVARDIFSKKNSFRKVLNASKRLNRHDERERERANEIQRKGKGARTCEIHFHARESKEFPVIIIFFERDISLRREGWKRREGEGASPGTQCGPRNTGVEVVTLKTR